MFTKDEEKCLSGRTVKDHHTVLSSLFSTAVQWQVIPSNPCSHVKPPKYKKPESRYLDENGAAALIAALSEEPYHYQIAVYTLLYTGLRRGEICGLRWDDFDEKEGVLKIRRSIRHEKGGRLVAGATKTGSGTRKIVLPESTAELLRDRKRSSFSEWIFPSFTEPEKPISPNAAYHHLKVLLKRAGLPDIRFHDCRHTFSSHALASGVDPKTLSGILGHTNASFTLDTYAHVTGDMQKRAAVIVGDFIDDILGVG